MRRLSAGAVAVLCVAAIGCGSNDDSGSSPIACTGGTSAYVTALKAAPDDVLLDGQTPISDCLVEAQGAGDLADVGQSIVGAGTELNRRSQDDPGGAATVQLGYLVGAVTHGAETTAGIHQDLVRRLEAAANYVPGGGDPDPAFEDSYDTGFTAGMATG